jgi:dTDP-glucose pyrophosphorylase
MAGLGSRFAKAGFTLPKPLIEIESHPMIRLVINNLLPTCEHRFIFVCQRQHLIQYDLEQKLKQWSANCEIIAIEGITEGAACTVLRASHLIDNDAPLMIANSDQWIDMDINDYLDFIHQENLDGLIMTMTADDPKWSFVQFDSDKKICAVVEKQVVSNEATVGIYNFRTGKSFCNAAKKMIANNFRVNGEFYVAPIYNELIAENKKIGIYNIGEESNGMYGLGIPADLEKFISSSVLSRAISIK